MYPDDAFYDDEDDLDPSESDLLDIERDEYEYMEDLGWLEDYEPFDWSDVTSEHDYNDGDE